MMSDSYCASVGPGSREPDQQAVPALPGFDPSRRSWIWDHARALGRAIIQMAPEDMVMSFEGGLGPLDDKSLRISCTIHSAQEAEAVREIIAHLAKSWLSSRREMIREDIYPPSPKPTFRDELDRMFGASAIEARQGGDGEAGSVHESAAPKADAQPQDPTP